MALSGEIHPPEISVQEKDGWQVLPVQRVDPGAPVLLSRAKAQAWALTLAARQIPCRMAGAGSGGGW